MSRLRSRLRAPALALVVLGGIGFLRSGARAVDLAVDNPGFEDPALADGTSLATAAAGWQFSPTGGVPYPLIENPAGLGAGVVEGEQRIRLRTSSVGSTGSIRQVLSATYLPNVTYTFSVTPIDVDASGAVPQFQILLEGLAARTVLGAEVYDALGRPIAVSGTVLPGHPLIGQNVTIAILVTGEGGQYGAISFDRVRVWAAAIPEPATGPLSGIGLAAIAARARRRRPADLLASARAANPARG